MPPPAVSPLLIHSSQSPIQPSLRCFTTTPLLSFLRPYSSSPAATTSRRLVSTPRSRQSLQIRPNRTAPSNQSSSLPPDGLSLKTKSIILAVAIAAIAASGALIGASLRQEVQRSTNQGSTLFSKVGSVQVVGAEALAAATENDIGEVSEPGSERIKQDNKAIANLVAQSTSPRTGLSVTTGETVAGVTRENSETAAQIKLLEARRAALLQQKLVTEKKMEALRQRIAERVRREEESSKDSH